MKRILTKPVLSVLAVATLAGGITPVLASSVSEPDDNEETKVVMDAEEEDAQRYRLKDLEENNEALLDLLLKTQGDNLYVVVEEIGLDKKLSELMEDEEAWKELLEEHYGDIYLEIRYDEEDGFVKLEHETKEGVTYIKGKVSDGVTRVVVQTPDNEITVESFVEQGFTVSFPAVVSSAPVYVTLKAYDDSKLLDSERIRINNGTVQEEDVVLHAMGVYLSDKDEVKVNGLVDAEADQVKVRYDGEEKEAKLKKLWSGVKGFSVSFPADEEVDGDAPVEAVVEAYKDGQKIDTKTVEIVNLDQQPEEEEATFAIKGSATLSAKHKTVYVKGTVAVTGEADGKLKLMIVAPDGKRHEAKLTDKGEFEATVPYHNRSYSSKAVRVELYVDGKLAAYADIPHGVPQNVVLPPVNPAEPVDDDHDDDDDGKDKWKEKWQDKAKSKDKDKGSWHGWKHGGKKHDELYLAANHNVKGKDCKNDKGKGKRDRDDD